jgi:NAD+ synthase
MELQDRISLWLKKYLKNNDLKSLVIGISGGIDSAVTSTLCAMTGYKTTAVIMPILQNPDHTKRGEEHCVWLERKYNNVQSVKIDLTHPYNETLKSIPEKFQNNLSSANMRARLRMLTLYMVSSTEQGVVVGTGNKVEDFGVGFFTKYGDGGVDVSPIGDLMKSEVYSLANNIGIIDSIIEAPPTDGLWDDNRTDEEQLGVSYDDLEWAMNYKGTSPSLKEKRILEIYNKHRRQNMHKMQDIPVFKK